jgi:hypothetical protein
VPQIRVAALLRTLPLTLVTCLTQEECGGEGQYCPEGSGSPTNVTKGTPYDLTAWAISFVSRRCHHPGRLLQHRRELHDAMGSRTLPTTDAAPGYSCRQCLPDEYKLAFVK